MNALRVLLYQGGSGASWSLAHETGDIQIRGRVIVSGQSRTNRDRARGIFDLLSIVDPRLLSAGVIVDDTAGLQPGETDEIVRQLHEIPGIKVERV